MCPNEVPAKRYIRLPIVLVITGEKNRSLVANCVANS